MIHLDANFLIGAADGELVAELGLRAWLLRGENFSASSIAWAEFLNGPVNAAQIEKVTILIQGRIVPFGLAEAEVAALLFNRTGRKRGSRPDCFVAATAICAGTPLATLNKKDFTSFVAHGLQLA